MTAAEPGTGTVRTAHASGLGAVIRELGDLHRAMLRAGGEDDAVRLSVMTLVAVCTGAEEIERAAAVVSAISADHPARALLVLAEPAGEPGISADLRLECGIGGRAAGVCAELVELRVGGDAALRLAGVVTPLLLPDVPVHLWIPGAPRLEQALAAETLALCESVIVDTAAFPDAPATLARLHAAVGGRGGTPLVDLTWLRLTAWREILARAFDAAPRRELLAGVDLAEVRGRPAPARLLAGWLGSRLELDSGRLRVEESDAGPGPVSWAQVRSRQPAEAAVTVEHTGDALRSQVEVDGRTLGGRSLPWEDPPLADLVGTALQEGGGDPVQAAALAVAASLGP